MRSRVKAALDIVHALDDPFRYAVLTRLVAGPATVSELLAETGAAQSQLSNHLGVLFDRGVVTRSRRGRFIAYGLAGLKIAAVMEAVDAAAATPIADGVAGRVPDIVLARRCYDHLAGRLGVSIFASLVSRRALKPVVATPETRKVRSGFGDVPLGRRAKRVFGELGVELDELANQRRRFATACNDWTESKPHLGGALGAALQAALCREGWLRLRSGTRAVRITPDGRRELGHLFGPLVADVLA